MIPQENFNRDSQRQGTIKDRKKKISHKPRHLELHRDLEPRPNNNSENAVAAPIVTINRRDLLPRPPAEIPVQSPLDSLKPRAGRPSHSRPLTLKNTFPNLSLIKGRLLNLWSFSQFCHHYDHHFELASKKASKVQSCTCSRSKCIKKYCDCYSEGRKCGKDCKCEGCENQGPDYEGPHQEPPKVSHKLKKEAEVKVEHNVQMEVETIGLSCQKACRISGGVCHSYCYCPNNPQKPKPKPANSDMNPESSSVERQSEESFEMRPPSHQPSIPDPNELILESLSREFFVNRPSYSEGNSINGWDPRRGGALIDNFDRYEEVQTRQRNQDVFLSDDEGMPLF